MSVIVELGIPADEFELGRILDLGPDVTAVLETMVPLGERAVPFFRVQDGGGGFEAHVRDHEAVESITLVSEHDGEVLYAIDWDASTDTFFEAVMETEGQLLEATGTAPRWRFQLRFSSHEKLSAFQERCVDAGISIDVTAVYNPTKPTAGPWYGLSAPQREALMLAAESGYYGIPRGIATQELAAELGISDQAVTERLRRGITTLVANTLQTD